MTLKEMYGKMSLLLIPPYDVFGASSYLQLIMLTKLHTILVL